VVNVVTIATDLQAGRPGVGLLAGRYGQVVAVLRYLILGCAAPISPKPPCPVGPTPTRQMICDSGASSLRPAATATALTGSRPRI
jgi:hypothetical protein